MTRLLLFVSDARDRLLHGPENEHKPERGCHVGADFMDSPSVHLSVIQFLRKYPMWLFSESRSSLGRHQDATWDNFWWKKEATAGKSHSRNGHKECLEGSIFPETSREDPIC